MQPTSSGSGKIESAIVRLRRMSPESQASIASIIDRLAEAEKVQNNHAHRPPAENIDQWLTKLRSERKSETTIRLYEYLTRRFLEAIPVPTRAEVRG